MWITSMRSVSLWLVVWFTTCMSHVADASSTPLRLRTLQQGYVPAGLQSGPDTQSTYAAASVYNPADNTLLVTGTSFGQFGAANSNQQESGCFLALAQLPTDAQGTLEWIHVEQLTQPNVPEGCNAIMLGNTGRRVWMAGHTEQGGLLDSLTIPGTIQETVQYGMLMDVEVTTDQKTFNLIGGRILQESETVYPVALSEAPGEEWLYVVTMETESTARNEQFVGHEFDPTRFFRYGSIYSMKVTRYEKYDLDYDPNELQRTLRETWINEFNNGDQVHVAGIIRLSDTVLVVAGSTSGWGEGFGPEPETPTDDFDGFVTKLEPEYGRIVQDAAPSARIQSPGNLDDFVAGICHSPKDTKYFYITGSTRGQLGSESVPNSSVQAFFMKIDVDTLQPVWTKQIGADSPANVADEVRGVSCTVSPDNEVVYFGGVVEQDAVLPESGTTESYGGNDIFVGRVATKSGIMEGIRQIGTSGDDELAMRGGLTTDQHGNAVVVGNTFGSMYRKRSKDEEAIEYADVFVFTVSRFNGDIKIPYDHPEFKDAPKKEGTGEHKDKDQDTPPKKEVGDKGKVEAPQEESPSDSSGTKKWAGLTALLVLLIFGVVVVAAFVAKRKAHREVHTDRSHVLDYVQKFDVEDIDLKHSATGGWHCSYANDLAEGKDNNLSDTSEDGGNGLLSPRRATSTFDPLTAPLTSSSILEDSLFMEEDEPSSGLDGPSPSSSGYDGLVDAYNSTWNSRTSGRSKRGDTWGRDIV